MLRNDDQYCRARKVVKRLGKKVKALTPEERRSGEYDALLKRYRAGCEEVVAYEWNFWKRRTKPACG